MSITKRQLQEIGKRWQAERDEQQRTEDACKRGKHPWHWHAGHQRYTCPECGAMGHTEVEP